ncbi:MAG: hypothetical protein ACYC8T_11865 [Myxococcaceae bacterium]
MGTGARITWLLLAAAFLPAAAALAQTPPPSAPPLVGVEEEPPASMDLTPPPAPVEELEQPGPTAPPAAVEDSAPNEGPRAQANESRTARLIALSLAGIAGIAVGVGLPMYAAEQSCLSGGWFCAAPVILAFPGGAFLPPAFEFAAGRSFGGQGGFGWALLGSVAGWAMGGVITLWALPREFNPGGGISLASVLFSSSLALAGGVGMSEFSSWKRLESSDPISGLRLFPFVAPGGSRGLGVAGAF